MYDQQVVDYIKQAKSAGQTAEQIKSALLANGWTNQEITENFRAAGWGSQLSNASTPAAITQTAPPVEEAPKETSPMQNPKPLNTVLPQYQPAQSNTPKVKSSHMVLKLLIVLIILAIIGGVGYFAITQEGLLKSFFNQAAPAPAQTENNENANTSASAAPVVNPTPTPTPAWCHTFDKNLGWADSGTEEITQLHTALEKEGFSYAPDTGNIYNTGTSQALIQFQTKYGLTPSNGFAGTKTRAELNSLYGCETTQPSIIK